MAAGALGATGGAALAAWLAAQRGGLPAGFLAGAVALTLAAALWRQGYRMACTAGRDREGATGVASTPLIPWLAGWPLLLLAATNELGRQQLADGGGVVSAYLAGWCIAGSAGLWLWLRLERGDSVLAEHVTTAAPGANPGELEVAASTPEASAAGPEAALGMPEAIARGSGVFGRTPGLSAGKPGTPEAGLPASMLASAASGGALVPMAPLAWVIIAIAAVAYWNGAVLDPLQFRGFPDYVTQMAGARKLIAGQLPYDPNLRVWVDVNLPPITLLLLFVPFSALSELTGKLAYFALNHAAFFAGLASLIRGLGPAQRQRARWLWTAGLLAVALTFEPWHDSLRLGQQNGIVLGFLALSAVSLAHRRDGLAGIGLALALIGKPSSAFLGLYVLRRRRWLAAGALAATGVIAFAISLPWAGLENWRFYLLEKAPHIAAGTPQQSNVALLALHARLFLPAEALSSFDAMPDLPAAQALTRVAQVLGLVALWRLCSPGMGAPGRNAEDERRIVLLEFAVTLVLSLSLLGHAWQSYVTWLIVAFVPVADPAAWQTVPRIARAWIAGLFVVCYVVLSLNDVALFRVIGNTSTAGAIAASLPNLALPVLAFTLALLLKSVRQAASPVREQTTTSP